MDLVRPGRRLCPAMTAAIVAAVLVLGVIAPVPLGRPHSKVGPLKMGPQPRAPG